MTNNTHAARYAAANETGSLEDPNTYHSIDRSVEVDLSDPTLGRITRLRLLTDRDFPYWDLSYCHGELKDGTPCRVRLPRHQFRKSSLKGDLLAMCREAKVFGKGLGLFDALSTLR